MVVVATVSVDDGIGGGHRGDGGGSNEWYWANSGGKGGVTESFPKTLCVGRVSLGF